MYTDWFQLGDRPFAITPDPRFLFLSERHREALAHLLYGVTESGGFIQLTGEVGTGKTTLTRTLLEQLPENVDAALVYNAHASLEEFLETICDELGVALPPAPHTPKRLIDALNAHLLEAHARGRRTVLIVDEAQNLGPELLEQIRLLTNLETHREKLLQILLIGQPELREVLARNDLRQLAQRITARYHLAPLDESETAAYVRHRLEVAGAHRAVFTPRALRQLHRASGGVPRLINILADRALLGAFADRHHEIDAGLVRRAAAEVRGDLEQPSRAFGPFMSAGILVLATAVAAAVWFRPVVQTASIPMAASAPAVEPIVDPATERVVEPTLADLLSHDDDLAGTTAKLLELWGVQLSETEGLPATLCSIATDNGLACVRGRGTWNNLRTLNRPALIELRSPEQTRTLLMTGLDDRTARVWIDQAIHSVSILELDGMWLGEYLLVWRPEADGDGVLRLGSEGPAVSWLRDALTQWSGIPLTATQVPQRFDATLEAEVRRFQQALGLNVDGIAGEQTMVYLDGLVTGQGPRLDGGADVLDP